MFFTTRRLSPSCVNILLSMCFVVPSLCIPVCAADKFPIVRIRPAKTRAVDTANETTTAEFDRKQYSMLGTGGGRAGLPEVDLYCRRAQKNLFYKGAGGWNDVYELDPKEIRYPSWNFWHFGVWDALMQLFYQQATDVGRTQRLGRYHLKLKSSSVSCWNEKPEPAPELVLDLSDEVATTENSRADRVVIYGKQPMLWYNGSALLRINIDKNRSVRVEVLQSTMPPQATRNLQDSIASLDQHPVVSFPIDSRGVQNIELVAEFTIKRKPGSLKVWKQPVPGEHNTSQTSAPQENTSDAPPHGTADGTGENQQTR